MAIIVLHYLTSIPGIALITGITFLSEIDDISRFGNSDRFSSFIGLVPMCHSSGEKDGTGGLTIRKNSILRSYITESAWVAIRYDPAMTLAYEQYCKRMASNKAIIKIARKLINRIYFVLKHKKMYEHSIVK